MSVNRKVIVPEGCTKTVGEGCGNARLARAAVRECFEQRTGITRRFDAEIVSHCLHTAFVVEGDLRHITQRAMGNHQCAICGFRRLTLCDPAFAPFDDRVPPLRVNQFFQ